jgi:hypothetical protein
MLINGKLSIKRIAEFVEESEAFVMSIQKRLLKKVKSSSLLKKRKPNQRKMTHLKSFYLGKKRFLGLSFVLSAFLIPLTLSSQNMGLKIKGEAAPPQYFTEKNRFQPIENQYLAKKYTFRPNKIPSVFSVETLPFFCKIEYKMGLQKKLPLKFRLGDVQYVDELERKRHN